MLFEPIPEGAKELQLYDSGHALPSESIVKAVQWFGAHLK